MQGAIIDTASEVRAFQKASYPACVLKPVCRLSPLEQPAKFRTALRKWFARHGRDYPWRRTQDPYAVLVSEVMLQQTQIATVLGRGFYARFLERFPNVESLAAAGDDELLKTWEGLGYYRRARMLREAAKAVIALHRGEFPCDHAALLALPGVGKYTAGAVCSFAFDQPSPIVDGNIARVFSRLFDCADPIDTGSTQKWLWQTAEQLLDLQQPRIYNSALMELGQTYCRPGVPDCLSCPVAEFCAAREPGGLPVKAKRQVIEEVDEHAILLVKDGKILLSRQGKGRRQGMWRLPVREKTEVDGLPILHRRKYGITRYRVSLFVHRCPLDHPAAGVRENDQWVERSKVVALVIPPADRSALEAVLDDREEIA